MMPLTSIWCNAAAVDFVRTIRNVVNEKPIFLATGTSEVEATTKDAKKQRRLRNTHREMFHELSRYYPLEGGLWTRPTLLSEGKQGLIQCAGVIPLTHFLISGGGS
jgi:hypothetical protein